MEIWLLLVRSIHIILIKTMNTSSVSVKLLVQEKFRAG